MFIVHSFEYIATFLDMLSNTVWTKKTHIHTFHSHQNYACRILQITDAPYPLLDPCNVLQEMKIHIAWILHISHPLKTYQHIPSYTNYVNHPASLVTDKTPPFLPEVLVDLLASGPDFRPPLHPQPEVGGKFLGLGSQQRFRKLKLLWRRTMRVSTSTTLILIRHVHSP